jgi:hypothetical protein
MFIDARSVPDGAVVEAEVCVVAQVPPELLWHESSTTAVVLVESGGTSSTRYKGPICRTQYWPVVTSILTSISRATMTDDEQRIRKTALLALGVEME